MQLSPAHDEGADIIEAELAEPALDHLVLPVGVDAGSRRDGREAEQRASFARPVQPAEFVRVGDPLQRLCSHLEDRRFRPFCAGRGELVLRLVWICVSVGITMKGMERVTPGILVKVAFRTSHCKSRRGFGPYIYKIQRISMLVDFFSDSSCFESANF